MKEMEGKEREGESEGEVAAGSKITRQVAMETLEGPHAYHRHH